MRIGVPKERKPDEYRVALTPGGVASLVRDGHQVQVEAGAGEGSGFGDDQYRAVGAEVVPSAEAVWSTAEMVVKVKEPLPEEYRFFRPDLVLVGYLHLAPEPELTRALIDSGMAAIGYETIQLDDGSLPLLEPMSEVAGRMAAQVGAQFLERAWGGRGVLLGGVPGVLPGRVVVVGGGIVGTNAARVALGLGAEVTVLDVDPRRLRWLDDYFRGQVRTLFSTPYNLAQVVEGADLVVGAVLIPGAKAPHLVTEAMVRSMGPGAVVVDVAVDQGGSVETVDHPTTHSHPTYVRHGVIHYAVANMPGAVPRTATYALTHASLDWIRELAASPLEAALRRRPALARGLNVYRGRVTHPRVAEAHRLPWADWTEVAAR
ncbi:MAG: alanine dehydrogenase [Firmicutes bacterium]|nr:alanine dehydrogenase [Alicyclobacillaceae bacterium]MCL6496696.1 alanine dehydrogenase [Bacillota bacterium]